MFSLKLLGGASIEGAAGPLTGRVSQRRRLALLCVLALSRDRPVSRDKLLALFWPESESERARHSLADSLYQIRKELGDNGILSSGDELRLSTTLIWSDAGEFETALERGDLQTAVAAYSGPLLDGFHLSDAPEFERWLDAERERFARAHAKALEQLAEEATRCGDAKSALEWWLRLAAADAYNSRITLRVMEAMESAGDRAGAIQQARIHAALLEQEFGAEPDPAVAALAERIRSAPIASASSANEALTLKPQSNVMRGSPAGDTAIIAASPVRAAPPSRTAMTWRAMTAASIALVGFAAVLSMSWLLPRVFSRSDAAAGTRIGSAKAIAVLPFTNLSRDPDEDYFSDGLTEELISVLSRVRALRVAARTSAFAFKGENRDIREIGRTLGVGAVLEGSVRRDGDRVRVIAQLINVADGFHLWSQTYEQELTDIFVIQSDLALQIANALEAELTPADRERLARRPTDNPEAYALYLKGRHFWNQRTGGGFARAIEYFERAIEADPRYAAAYAGLATAYSLQGLSGYLAPSEAREQMREAAGKAVELDDDLAEAHAALGAYLHVYEWEFDAAEREHLRAIELDPSYPIARHFYGNVLLAMGRFEEAVAQKIKAVELDPLDPALSESLGLTLLQAGRPDDAFERLRDALELDSTFWRVHASLGSFYETTGRLEEAISAFERAAMLAESTPRAKVGLARVLALAGREERARRILAELRAEATRTGIHAPDVATVFLALDDADAALAWLEHSYDQRHPQLRFIGGSGFKRFEDDPRYINLLRRLGLRN